MGKDYRKNQEVVATLMLDDRGQDFIELDILENGVMLGNSIMFKNGRLSLIGIGTLNGSDYFTFNQLKNRFFNEKLKGFFIYIKDTDKKEPFPWKAETLKYSITGTKKVVKPNRFIIKK